MLPELVIVVSGTHWHCVACKLDNKRTVSLDQHLLHSHPSSQLLLQATTPDHTPSGVAQSDCLQDRSKRSSRKWSKKNSSSTGDWLSASECCDGNDDTEIVGNEEDNDSDFVPSDVGTKRPKRVVASLRMRRGQQTKNKKQTVKKQGVGRLQSKKKSKIKVETQECADRNSNTRFQYPLAHVGQVVKTQNQPVENKHVDQGCEAHLGPHDEQEQTVKNDIYDNKTVTADFLPRRSKRQVQNTTGIRPGSIRKGSSEPTSASDSSVSPRKRGRPPKPKIMPELSLEEEDLSPKRPYRRKVPDPAEMLLKLRNVGRKPNARTKLPEDEKKLLASRFAQFVRKGSLAVNVEEQGETVQGDDYHCNLNTSFTSERTDNESRPNNISQDSQSSQDVDSTASSSAIQARKEKMRCRTCSCVFSTDKHLREHLSKCGSEDVMQCRVCTMNFHGELDLNLHIFCDHEREQQPVCLQCWEDFTSMEGLERHLYTRHKGEEERAMKDRRFHDCCLCQMELNVDLQLIKNHYYRRHKAYVCPDCFGKGVELVFYTDQHLYSEHKSMHAKSPAECNICQVRFPTASEMKAHRWTHATDSTDDGSGGKCARCDKWLPNSGAMVMHEREHKNEAIRKSYALEASIGFPCMKCGHIFSSKSNLKKHSCKSDPNRTFFFRCEYCAHGCNAKEQLRDHIALHHLGLKRYSCKYCDQCFVCAPTLRRHVRRVHTQEQPYQCHVCQERFYERNVMLRHVAKHTGVASFICEHCGKSFHTKFDLKKHTENHTISRVYICPHCGLDYKRSYHLKRHLHRGCKKLLIDSAAAKPKSTHKSAVPMKRDKPTSDGSDSASPVATVGENVAAVMSEGPLVLQDMQDADEMVFLDLAADDCTNDDGDSDDDDGDGDDDGRGHGNGKDDGSSGPDFVEDDYDGVV